MQQVVPKFDFDKKFQSKLVRVLYQFPDESRDVLLHLEPGMFDTAPMRWTVRKLKQFVEDSGNPATDTMLEFEAVQDVQRGIIQEAHIDAYAKYIDRLTSKRKVTDKTYILDKSHEYVRYVLFREFLIDSAQQMQDIASVDWRSINQSLDMQRQFGERSAGDLGQDYFGDTDARIERRKHVEGKGIPTGTVVDEYLRHGGMPPKCIGVILAPTGRGKTAALVYIGGTAITLGYNVLHISVEMDEDLIAERYDSRFTGIRMQRLTKRAKHVRAKLAVLAKKHKGRLKIKFYPPGRLTMAGLRAYLRRLEASSFYPDMVILDYADNMSLEEYRGKNSDNDYGPLGRLYVDFRGLMGELNIRGWTASQSNRLGFTKDSPDLGDIAGSIRKAEVSDLIVAIGQNDDERLHTMARLVIPKNRLGPTGSVDTVKFDTARIKIWDAE